MKTFQDYNIDIPAGATGEIRTTCPECSLGRRKSGERCLAVNTSKGTWLCHHCGWSSGLKNGKKMKSLSKAPEKQKNHTMPKYAPRDTRLPDKVLEWFRSREIPEDVLTRNRIGYGPVFMPGIGKEVPAIQFPYFRDGQVINVKYRDDQKNFCMEKGAERVLYGLDDIEEFMTVFVEGEMDKLSCEAAGFMNTVSVPDGAPSENTKNYSSKFCFLESAEKQLDAVHKFIIAVDNDGPGSRLKDELIRRLGPGRCWVTEWPAGCKDANDVLVNYGKDRLSQCLREAQPVPVDGIFSVSDIRQRIEDLYEYGYTRGESTGWKSLDKHYTVRPGEMTIVTGIPSHGKSEWIDALICNLARIQGWAFGICSPENYPLERHAAKLIEKISNAPFTDRLSDERISRESLTTTLDMAEQHFHFLMPNEEDLSIEGVLNLAKVLVFRHGIQGLVIDPWNELDHSRPDGMTETECISRALTKVRRFARTHNVHVWLVAHPSKLYRDKKNGTYPVPTPYDISGSANWRNKADNCITVWRDLSGQLQDVEIHVQKIRFKEIGKPGKVDLRYDFVTGRYYENSL